MWQAAWAAWLICVGCAAAAWAKDGPTYYTGGRVAVGRENVAQYDWARAIRKRIIETGDTIQYYIGTTYTAAKDYAAQSDEFIWLLQPPTEIPRTYDVGFRTICPECGPKVKTISVWNAWRIDPISHPYQVQCRLCKTWYPSNAYHKGDMTSGPYPDDGSGWEHDGQRYYFLREYAHMCYGTVVVPSLRSLTQAWLLTGDRTYAHKASVLLARLATQYPNYGWERVRLAGVDTSKLEDRRERTYMGPFGGRHPHYTWKSGGMITDLIWETFCLEATAYAYDAVYDHIGRDAGLIAFCKAKGMPVETADDLRRYIETYIFRAAMDALLEGHIKGNEGFHQAAALAVALVLDDYDDRNVPNSKTMVDYAYHGIGQSATMLVNGLDRDGGGHESPNYNAIKRDFIRVSQLMELVRRRRPDLFGKSTYPDLFAHPKARSLFDYYIDILLHDSSLPSIGDCGGIRDPRRVAPQYRRYSFLNTDNIYAFRRYGDPRFARASTKMNGDTYGGKLWEPYPAEAIAEALKRPESHIHRTTRLLDGYGVGILESGDWPHRRTVMLNYASTIGHRQKDPLTLGLHARGVDLLPDLGYPRTWDYRWRWDANSMAHNTVTVDETQPPHRFFRNACRLFAVADGVHVVTAHHNPYPVGTGLGRKDAPPVDLYERTAILVDVDDERFYVVDVFAVRGGEQHDQSWHAMRVRPKAPTLDWRAQPTGTLAGPDVEPFAGYTDRWGRRHERGDLPSFVTDIRRATLDKPAVWAWPSGLGEGDALAMHIVPVGGPAEVIMGRGRSPVWPEDEALDLLFVRRQPATGAPSHFVTVLDGYQKVPVVEAVRLVKADPITLRIDRADGADEVTLRVPPGPSRTTAHRPVGVRVRSLRGDRRRDVRIGMLGGGGAPGYVLGEITALDYEARWIDVSRTQGDVALVQPGRHVRIHHPMRSAMFRIEAVHSEPDRLRLTLDKTALMARFPVTAIEKGRLILGARSPFATGHIDKKTGALTDGPNDFFYGAWVGQGQAARQVAGIANTTPQVLHVVGEHAQAKLDSDYRDETVSVWVYGVGDHVEVCGVEAAVPE